MAAVEVRPVSFERDRQAFVDSWWHIYDGDPCWVPPLRSDLFTFLNPEQNPYFKVATIQPFMAYQGGQAVGTLACTVDHYQKEHEPGVGLFGFFEFVNDPEVAAALMEAGITWFREQGIHTIRGPFNFNTNHEFGLLISRFDDIPCVGNPHNGWWYPGIYEKALEMEKARDWYCYWFGFGPVPDRMKRIADRFLDRNPQVTIREMDTRNFWQDVELFWDLYNDAWSENWGHIYMQKEEFLFKAKALKPVLDPKLAYFAYVDGEPAAASITLPDYNQVAVHMDGRLFPKGWFYYLNRNTYINRLRVLVLGVKQEFQNLPLGAPLYVRTWQEAKRRGTLRAVEASLILEDNHRMNRSLQKLGGEVHKTYRTYTRQIAEPPAPEA